jgi:hypothetical protein
MLEIPWKSNLDCSRFIRCVCLSVSCLSHNELAQELSLLYLAKGFLFLSALHGRIILEELFLCLLHPGLSTSCGLFTDYWKSLRQ